MNKTKCIGLDVSKDNVCVHCLTEYPKGGVSLYWEKTRTKESKLYPRFYSNPKKRQRSPWDFLKWLEKESPDVAILEPTGVHYSKLWAQLLTHAGVRVYWVGHMELKRHRQGKNLKGHTKNDAVDALAMASYWFDVENRLPDGRINPEKFLRRQPESILRLRELVQFQEHLVKVQSPIINFFRQMLTWQFPEMSRTNSRNFYKWLLDPDSAKKRYRDEFFKKYQDSIANEVGFSLDPHLGIHGHWLEEIVIEEERLMGEIKKIMTAPEFADYIEIFDLFGFGSKIRAKLLTRIYPFEGFLLNNAQELIEYERRETREEERSFKDGSVYVKFSKGKIKRVKRNRSRDSFKLRLGFGSILESSGDGWKMKPHGSSLCRKSIYQYIYTQVESSRTALPENHLTEQLLDKKDQLKELEVFRGQHIQGKLMSRCVNLLYKEFKRRFCF